MILRNNWQIFDFYMKRSYEIIEKYLAYIGVNFSLLSFLTENK
jgi:hypothetical protein